MFKHTQILELAAMPMMVSEWWCAQMSNELKKKLFFFKGIQLSITHKEISSKQQAL